MPRKVTPLRDRFERYVHHEPNTGCHLWGGCADSRGYGYMHVGTKAEGTRRCERAHRVAWELSRGQSPGGLDVLHSCDFPPCVNPDHLFLGDDADNRADMARKGRGVRGSHPFGVSTTRRGFRAVIQIQGRAISLGHYDTIGAASAAAAEAKGIAYSGASVTKADVSALKERHGAHRRQSKIGMPHGVKRAPGRRRFSAGVRIAGKTINLGSFDTAERAGEAVLLAELLRDL